MTKTAFKVGDEVRYADGSLNPLHGYYGTITKIEGNSPNITIHCTKHVDEYDNEEAVDEDIIIHREDGLFGQE